MPKFRKGTPCKKVRYRTRADALVGLESTKASNIANSKSYNNVGLYVYRCRMCDMWHLGHHKGWLD